MHHHCSEKLPFADNLHKTVVNKYKQRL